MGTRDRPRSAPASGAKKQQKHAHKPKQATSPGSLGKRRAAEELPRPKKVPHKNTKNDKPRSTASHRDAKKHFSQKQNGEATPQNADKMLSRKERKEIAHAKLSATKKNFNLIQSAIQQWEKARPKATSEADRKKLVADLVGKISGKVMELANHHSASRVIQFCLKHGSAKDKKTVMGEIKPNVVDLARSKYGHYLARKLINIASKEEVPGLVKLFRGQVVALARHPYATDVLMDLYDVASTSERNAMRAEFYGREYALFDGVQTHSGSITGPQQLLEGASGSKRKAIFQHMYKSLMPIMEKALLHPPMVHRLLRDFLHAAPTSLVEDAIDTLCQTGGEVFKMVHTHEGAEAVCMLLAYGSAKDRRHLLKGMKGYVKEIACNEWGHAAMCTAISCIDDTTLVKKIVIQELQGALSEVIEHKHGCKVLLQLLSPDNPRYMPPHILSMLHPPTRMTTTRQSATARADLGAQLHGEQDFDDGGEAADDIEEDGGFGGLTKVAKKQPASSKRAPPVVSADEDEEDNDDGPKKDNSLKMKGGQKQRGPLLDNEDDDEDEDEDEDEEGADEGQKQKRQLFEDDDEDDEQDEDEEEDVEEGAGVAGAKGKNSSVLKEIPWEEVEGLLGGDDGDEDEDGDMEEEDEDEDEDEEEDDAGEDAGDMEADNAAEDEGPRQPTVLGLSRKDNTTRRRELLAGGKGSLAQKLCNSCADATGDFLRHPVSCDLVVEVCRGGCDGLLAAVCPTGVAAVHDALLREISHSTADTEEVGPAPGPALQHVLQDYYGSRALRRLVLHAAAPVHSKDAAASVKKKLAGSEEGSSGQDAENNDESEGAVAVELVQKMWEQVLQGKCKDWFGSHADKVLSAFVFVSNPGVKEAAVKELKRLVKGDVMQWAQTFVRGDAVKSTKH